MINYKINIFFINYAKNMHDHNHIYYHIKLIIKYYIGNIIFILLSLINIINNRILKMNKKFNIIIKKENEDLVIKYGPNKDLNINNDDNDIDLNNLSLIKSELKSIFKDPGIIKAFLFCIYDNSLIENAQYFDKNYIPNIQDYYSLYHNTKNLIIDENINSKSQWNIFFTDISGKRSQRTLWSSILTTKYTCCLFVLSSSDYNNFNIKPLFINKLIESFELLHSLTSISQFMENASNLVIIFNKMVFSLL